jgi:hypothetical protein
VVALVGEVTEEREESAEVGAVRTLGLLRLTQSFLEAVEHGQYDDVLVATAPRDVHGSSCPGIADRLR